MGINALELSGYTLDPSTNQWVQAAPGGFLPTGAMTAALPAYSVTDPANAPTTPPLGQLPGLPAYSAAPAWASSLYTQPMAPLYSQPQPMPQLNLGMGQPLSNMGAWNQTAAPNYAALLRQMLGKR